jgi:hypothetical protein
MPRLKHDLVSIANPQLANELEVRESDHSLDSLLLENKELRDQTWRAILTLNIIRYTMAILFLIDISLNLEIVQASGNLFEYRPTIFLGATVALLASAIVFSYLSKMRKLEIEKILGIQFFIDLALTTTLIHVSDLSSNDWFFIYFLIVTTGSVALTRRQALGLASAAFIMMCIEQTSAMFMQDSARSFAPEALSGSGAILLISAFLISWLAYQIRKNQIRGYVPGGESLEAYLVREEVNAIRATLAKAKGNKTRAAKLLGLSFRSFRYKLAKYGLE